MRQLQRELARQKDLSHEQQWLIHILSAFLAVTLICIFVPAILGIIHADRLKMWVWTPWLLYVASAWLGLSSAYVVWQAARSIRTLAILTLLAMASPALAGPVGRCTTHYEPTLNRLMTLCDDGTRAVSTWSPTLQRWTATITESPRKMCTGQMNSRTQQVEVRCQ